jgi:hypothetical protein
MRKCKKYKRPQFCPKGHDTLITGRYKDGRCAECARVYNRQRRKRVTLGTLIPRSIKRFCIHGHDTWKCGREKGAACKKCRQIWFKKFHEEHKEERNRKSRLNYQLHKEERRLWGIDYRARKGEKLLKQKRQYGATHKKERNKKAKEKRETDMNYKLQVYLRARIRLAIKNNQKVGSAVKDLGCTIEYLKKYLEKKFYGRMSWENWGDVWELDHVIPLWKFDLTNRKQFLKAVNYKNLQPLTVKDHRKKNAKEAKEKHLLKKGK